MINILTNGADTLSIGLVFSIVSSAVFIFPWLRSSIDWSLYLFILETPHDKSFGL